MGVTKALIIEVADFEILVDKSSNFGAITAPEQRDLTMSKIEGAVPSPLWLSVSVTRALLNLAQRKVCAVVWPELELQRLGMFSV